MTTTITGLPNGTTPLDGTERVPMDQAGVTVDATTQDIADLSAEIQQLTCRNQTGSTIAKGTAVSFAGTLGTSGILLIKKTIADGTDPGYVFLGIAKEQILNGETGEVATFGKIVQVNTSAFSEGSILWCDPATPGGLTETEPEAPNLKLPVAVVINSGFANGSLMVRSNIGSRLADLHDVQANGSKTDGDALRWNAAAGRWQPEALATVASTGAYSDLSGTPTIPPAADAAPQPLGIAAVGVSTDYAREDHVHVMPSATDVGADASGTAASAISTHEVAADPHPGYALESSLATVATSGAYSDLTGTPTLGGAAALDVGTTAGTVAAGDDSRLSTDLSYTASTRVLGSSTGAGATLPLFTSTDAGLAPLSGGGTTNFLRADGTWAAPASGGTPGGTTGQLQWNSAGSFAGVGGSSVGATGDITLSLNGAASTPPLKLTGTWFSGGTGTTTKPQVLIEPSGTTSTAWSTSGTGLGVNAASGFAGNLLDLRLNGASRAIVSSSGSLTLTPASNGVDQGIEFTASNGLTNSYIRNFPNAGALTIRSPGLVKIDTTKIRLPSLPTYADNTAATSGGLVAGDMYKTATGELRITV